jgi:hypothetical protein
MKPSHETENTVRANEVERQRQDAIERSVVWSAKDGKQGSAVDDRDILPIGIRDEDGNIKVINDSERRLYIPSLESPAPDQLTGVVSLLVCIRIRGAPSFLGRLKANTCRDSGHLSTRRYRAAYSGRQHRYASATRRGSCADGREPRLSHSWCVLDLALC